MNNGQQENQVPKLNPISRCTHIPYRFMKELNYWNYRIYSGTYIIIEITVQRSQKIIRKD